MRDADLDCILSKEEEILPSSGFAASVMEAVAREAAAPPPIPFPWKRAIPGLFAAGLVLAFVILASIRLLVHNPSVPPIPAEWRTALASIVALWRTFGASWVVLALVLSLASVKLSMHLATVHGSRSGRI